MATTGKSDRWRANFIFLPTTPRPLPVPALHQVKQRIQNSRQQMRRLLSATLKFQISNLKFEIMNAQRSLNLSISQRTVLLTVDALRVHLGVDADTVLGRVDAGEYRWVFDVSSVKQRRLNSAKHVRELRLWAKEIVQPEVTSDLSAAAAVGQILGQRERFYGTEIAQLLLVSRPQIFRLHESKELTGAIVSGKLWVPRSVLENFLLKRLVNQSLTPVSR